jgi:hypothetical protein
VRADRDAVTATLQDFLVRSKDVDSPGNCKMFYRRCGKKGP